MKNDNPRPVLMLIFLAISMVITALVLIVFLGCSDAKELPEVQGTRLEVHEVYFKKYGMHTNQWKDEVKAAYNRDMDKARAE